MIAPVDEFIDRPLGKEPALIEYVIVSPSASVALPSNDPEIPLNPVPKLPADWSNTGAMFTSNAPVNVAERPDEFSSFIEYGSFAYWKSDLATVTVN